MFVYMRTLVLFFLFTSILFEFSAQGKPIFIKMINFTSLENTIGANYATFQELKLWANYQMMELNPDHPGMGLKDGICRYIPEQGLSFQFTADPQIKRPVYIYLDMANYAFKKKMAVPVRKLGIIVNGKRKSSIYFSQMAKVTSPVRIDMDSAEMEFGRIQIRLLPDAASNFWCIWDAYYSYEKDQE